MKTISRLLAGMLFAATSANAQDAAPACELHVWPTETYIGINMGLLSGFGIVGAVADVAVHEKRVATVKDLMKDWLGPEIQLAELEKLDYKKQLGLADYQVIMHPALPTAEDAKADPALKQQRKDVAGRIKSGARLTDSKTGCYAELMVDYIFYYKAMMYGSNLFTNWIFRDFGKDGIKVVRTGNGQVKNPLEDFPPKTPDMIAAAKVELRAAYAKDFTEYLAKKVK